MLKGKQKRQLRALANGINPIFQIGKGSISEEMIIGISEALEKRELIKINILQNCEDNKKFLADEIVRKTSSNLVQIIGNIIVLYKQSSNKKNRKIELVK